MVDNSLSWVVSSTQSKRTCRDNYIKNDAWKYEELVTPRYSVTSVVICNSLDLAMILKEHFMWRQNHMKRGAHDAHAKCTPILTADGLTSQVCSISSSRLPNTNPYVLVDQDGKSVADLYYVMKMLYTQTWSYDSTVIVYQLVTFYRQLSCW